MKVVCILDAGDYKPGDPRPEGYNAWHEWARVQHRAGLRQVRCGRCSMFKFPQELSGQVDRSTLRDTLGRAHPRETPVCLDCVR